MTHTQGRLVMLAALAFACIAGPAAIPGAAACLLIVLVFRKGIL